MTLSNIPFAVDGALIGSALLRRAVFASIGRDGVVGSTDLKVSASSPNAQSLRIAAGTGVILNGYQTDPNEVYVATNAATHNITSGDMPGSNPGTTYWMVCLVVGDPQAGYSQTGHPFMPSDFDESQANTYQYVRPVLLPCSSTNTKFSDLGKSYPGLALARLALPPSTTTVTDAMLTDLRNVLRPATDVGWTDLTPLLNAGWTAYTPGSYMPPQYKREGNTVKLRGVLLRATGASTNAFTLPSGFRPPFAFNAPTRYFNGSIVAMGSFFLSAAGVVTPDQPVNNSTYDLGAVEFDIV